MNPALETLMLAVRETGGAARPGGTLFLGAQAHSALAGAPALTGWQPHISLAAQWENAGFVRTGKPEGTFSRVLLLPGKSREEVLSGFALGRRHLTPGGALVAALANDTGAARFEKELARACGRIDSIQKHKCRAFFATDDGTWREDVFREWDALAEPAAVPGTDMFTVPGVFSAGRVDPGSALLAANLPAGLRGRAADLGAGWGFLSRALLDRCPGITAVDLFEADARALDLARGNLAAGAATTAAVSFHWHDVAAGVPGVFDVIVMNPPFHQGRETRQELGVAFIAAAAGALRRGGSLYLVANRQLPYEHALDRLGFSWRQTAADATYKILSAILR